MRLYNKYKKVGYGSLRYGLQGMGTVGFVNDLCMVEGFRSWGVNNGLGFLVLWISKTCLNLAWAQGLGWAHHDIMHGDVEFNTRLLRIALTEE